MSPLSHHSSDLSLIALETIQLLVQKLFSFLRYWIFCRFFPYPSTVSKFKGSAQKINLSKHVLQLKERLVTSSMYFLFFMILSINGDWVQKKNRVNFFMVSFRISSLWSFLKFQVIYMHWLFWAIYQNGLWVMGLVLSVDFLRTFSTKMLFLLIKYPIKWPFLLFIIIISN